MSPPESHHILLTGRPGIGKTTVIIRLAARLECARVAGFYTREIRVAGSRVGFEAVTLSGRSGRLAHVEQRGPHRVGRYGIDVVGFEALVLPELERTSDVFLIDEIGRMECFSSRFVTAVRRILDGPRRVVATVALSGGGFIAEVRNRPEVEIWQVEPDNRDDLPARLAARIAP